MSSRIERTIRPGALGVALALVATSVVCAGCPAERSGDAPREGPAIPPAVDPATTSAGIPSNVYFGDLHVHTALSADAFLLGTRASVDDAYRYAKGEPIAHVSGTPIQAKRALDFLAVTDHAEYLGMRERLVETLVEGAGPSGRVVEGLTKAFALMTETIARAEPHPSWIDEARSGSAWRETIEAANRHDAPGRFTTLLGFEWSATPEGRNLHRNVIVEPDGVLPLRPFSVFDSPNPEDLWAWMDEQRARGVRLLAIPHNSNLSDGAMFARSDSFGRPFDATYVEKRARNEPLVEVTQIKGTSETHPILSPEDEHASFEIWSSKVSVEGEAPDVTLSGSYVRDALRSGLELQARRGFNPYRFGLIGSTDSHSASSPVEEDNYSGKGVQDTTARMRLQTTPIPGSVQAWGASGLAAVWARANTRPEIFSALERKETYATTGTRIALRFFGGWGFDANELATADWVDRAYARGVPMGGDLPRKPSGAQAPAFLVSAQQDPESAKLDRIQIVKGWTVGEASHEKVYDAMVAPAEGARSLSGVWIDPDFAPSADAFYYVRVLEKPTPRWSTYDAKSLGIEPLAKLPRTIQERAFSSPIWYRAEP